MVILLFYFHFLLLATEDRREGYKIFPCVGNRPIPWLTAAKPYLPAMKTVVTEDGKIVIPEELRENAQLKAGDALDVQLYKGTIVLRKRQPLTREQCAELLERSRSQPKPTPEDDLSVEQAVQEVRAERR